MPIPDSYLQDLRARTDIEQLIAQYVSPLRRSGRLLMGLCPFHGEKSPSFAVYPDHFYCFGCGAGGDAISFLMRIERLDYIEAVKTLSERAGMQLPEEGYDDALAKKRLRILSANREAAKFFHAQLREPRGCPGLSYWIDTRGLSPGTVKHFGLGYAPEGWSNLLDHLRGHGYAPDELADANLVTRSERNGKTSYYDRFRGRVMVPILDLRGNVVAFGGRILGEAAVREDGRKEAKYINTSDTLAYKKGRDIYALHFAKNTAGGRLILVEGYMDVIALHQAGFTQAVACLGTALTKDQAQLLSRYAEEVILSYDADAAGQAATQKALAILGQTNLKLRVIHLSGGKDPDEILRAYGPEKYRQLLENAANDIEFSLLRARGDLDLSTPAGKADYLREAAKILARCGSIEQDIYASRLSEELSVGKEAILTQVSRVWGRANSREARQWQREHLKLQDSKALKIDPQRGVHPAAASAETRLLGLLLHHPDFYKNLRGRLRPEDLVTPFNRELCAKLFQRLEEGRGIEAGLLSGALTEQELDEAMRMRALAEDIASPLAELEGCAHKILEEKKGAQTVNVTQLDQTAYLDLFANMKKQGGAP